MSNKSLDTLIHELSGVAEDILRNAFLWQGQPNPRSVHVTPTVKGDIYVSNRPLNGQWVYKIMSAETGNILDYGSRQEMRAELLYHYLPTDTTVTITAGKIL